MWADLVFAKSVIIALGLLTTLGECALVVENQAAIALQDMCSGGVALNVNAMPAIRLAIIAQLEMEMRASACLLYTSRCV